MGVEGAGEPLMSTARLALCTKGHTNWHLLVLCDFSAWLSSHMTIPKLQQKKEMHGSWRSDTGECEH